VESVKADPFVQLRLLDLQAADTTLDQLAVFESEALLGGGGNRRVGADLDLEF